MTDLIVREPSLTATRHFDQPDHLLPSDRNWRPSSQPAPQHDENPDVPWLCATTCTHPDHAKDS